MQLTLAVTMHPSPDSQWQTKASRDTTIDMHISEEMLRRFLHDLNGRAKQLLSKGPIIFL